MNGPLDWEDELPDDDCDLAHAHSMFSELRLLSSLTTDPNRLIITNKFFVDSHNRNEIFFYKFTIQAFSVSPVFSYISNKIKFRKKYGF